MVLSHLLPRLAAGVDSLSGPCLSFPVARANCLLPAALEPLPGAAHLLHGLAAAPGRAAPAGASSAGPEGIAALRAFPLLLPPVPWPPPLPLSAAFLPRPRRLPGAEVVLSFSGQMEETSVLTIFGLNSRGSILGLGLYRSKSCWRSCRCSSLAACTPHAVPLIPYLQMVNINLVLTLCFCIWEV